MAWLYRHWRIEGSGWRGVACVCIALLLAGLAVSRTSAQSLPGAPAPVPGGLLDPNRNARPPAAKPAESPAPARPAEEAKPVPVRPPATAKPTAPPAQPTQQAKPRDAPREAAKPAAAPAPPRPVRPKLEPLALKVPDGYREPKAGKRSDTEVILHAVGTDLAPRYAKGGRCADPKARCPDFVNLIVFRTHEGVAETMGSRYKAPPESLRTFAAAHGLSQIPPRAARGYNTRHFLARVDGAPIWIVCHRYDAPNRPRPESRYCDLTFDVRDGVSARLIFHEGRLEDWRRMHAAARALAGRLQG